ATAGTRGKEPPYLPVLALILLSPAYFTSRSNKDEGVSGPGTPTEFNDRVWKYGLTAVYFNNGRVTSWDISPLNPIRPDGKRGAELVAALVEVVAEQRGGQRCVDEAGGDEVHPDGRHFERQVG